LGQRHTGAGGPPSPSREAVGLKPGDKGRSVFSRPASLFTNDYRQLNPDCLFAVTARAPAAGAAAPDGALAVASSPAYYALEFQSRVAPGYKVRLFNVHSAVASMATAEEERAGRAGDNRFKFDVKVVTVYNGNVSPPESLRWERLNLVMDSVSMKRHREIPARGLGVGTELA
jgi:hypothetical protein